MRNEGFEKKDHFSRLLKAVHSIIEQITPSAAVSEQFLEK